jgi:hypothetical protein
MCFAPQQGNISAKEPQIIETEKEHFSDSILNISNKALNQTSCGSQVKRLISKHRIPPREASRGSISIICVA